jgi:oxygen-dependent protoporphyrinogen oxidase
MTLFSAFGIKSGHMKKRILILGAGISGLSAAWYLYRTGLPLEVTILEKNSHVGGWLHTDHMTGFHFEKGARAFKVNQAPLTMRLIAELGLQGECIWQAKQLPRYLWNEGRLRRFPSHPISFLFSPMAKGSLRALMTEWKKPIKKEDETVWEFALRRFNADIARLFFDPMVVGIFGGDVRNISVRACFPKLKEWEEKYGSVTRGFFAQKKEKKAHPSPASSALFSLRCGMQQLPQTIASQIPATIYYRQEAKQISFNNSGVIVKTENEQFAADFLICALPLTESALLFESHVPDISKALLSVRSEDIAIVNFGYDAEILPMQGFGYLIPTHTHEEILGVVFDSSIFPEQNRNQKQTRLTIKLRQTGQNSEEKTIETALEGVRRQLGIFQMPKAISFKLAERAIPQYGVGHLEKMASLRSLFCQKLPRCQFIGNYVEGVSVESCVACAKKAVDAVEPQI